MPDETDKLERTKDGYRTRLRYGKGLRARFLIRTPDEAIARRRDAKLRVAAELLVRSGQSAHAFELLTAAAGAAGDREFAEFLKVAEDLCKESPHVQRAALARSLTFRDLGERWTSGDLHRDHPDQIKLKRTREHDADRLENHIYPVIGDKLVASITLDDAEAVMRSLPTGLTSLTRRHIGHLVVRLLNLAVWPLRLLPASPIPPGFLPQRGARKALAYLYPDEDRRLLECTDVPFCYRLLWGFLAREGMREGEAFALTWADLDLQRGMVRLDRNKTDDPRAWALEPGTARALSRHRALLRVEPEPGDLVFQDPIGRRHSPYGAAALLRQHLETMGLKRERPELFESTDERKQIRVHDLRGTFVTLSLANGRSEAWVAARTGHESSEMINRYRRTASSFQEINAGALVDLDAGLPELRGTTAAGGVGHGWASTSRNIEKNGRPQGDSNSNDVITEQHSGVSSAPADTPSDTEKHRGPGGEAPLGHVLAQADEVERALADALLRASRAEAWDAVRALTDELRARRAARAGVVDLEAERARRDRGGR